MNIARLCSFDIPGIDIVTASGLEHEVSSLNLWIVSMRQTVLVDVNSWECRSYNEIPAKWKFVPIAGQTYKGPKGPNKG